MRQKICQGVSKRKIEFWEEGLQRILWHFKLSQFSGVSNRKPTNEYLRAMRKFFVLFVIILPASLYSYSQTDSAAIAGIFERITKEIQNFRVDTSAVPNDRVTGKINELRQLRGGFNISEAISFKLQEDEKSGNKPKATVAFLRSEFENGKGKQWLDNAVNHIYRQHFTYKELKQLVKFYKTSAGQKLATDFPFIMMKSLMAGQMIHDLLMAGISK